jgi:Domain of unknown function (DUF4388)
MLKGSLEEFSLSDIFRLLAFTKKTGRLETFSGAGEGRVFFRDGEVYFAESSLKKEPLGQKLTRSGALSEGQLRKALDLHASSGEGVGEILLRGGAISQDQLVAAVREQIEDAVFDLLRWELGEFAFVPHERFTVEIPIAVSVESLIIEASRRLDELEDIRRKIPTPDVVLAIAPSPPQGAREINITPDEWRLLVLVDGFRSVQEVIEVGGLAEFAGLRTLHGLLSSGLVEVMAPGAQQDPSSTARPRLLAPPASSDVGPLPHRADELASPATLDQPGDAGPFDSDPFAPPSPGGVPGIDKGDASPPELSPAPPAETGAGDAPAFGLGPGPGPDGPPPVEEDGVDAAAEADAVQPVDRAAVVRELAGLFNDDEQTPRRPRSAPQPRPEEVRKRRVEDDEDITKGVIGRFIDGVKGM